MADDGGHFIAGFLATRALKLAPSGWQNLIEMVITALHEQIDATMGERGRMLAPMIIALFLFLLVANWIGLVPTLSSPTNDLNTTLGLALLVVVMPHVLGLYFKGMGYIKHFFQPVAPFVIINMIEEVAKPITLAFRLFGVILAGCCPARPPWKWASTSATFPRSFCVPCRPARPASCNGSAGRPGRDGNALTATVANAAPHDLIKNYYGHFRQKMFTLRQI